MLELNESLSYLLNKCNQKAMRISQKVLSDLHLTPSQAVALTFLYKKDGISQYELGEKAQKDRTTISGILSRLEDMGYIMRTPDPDDGRTTLVYLTGKALDVKVTLENKAYELNQELAEGLTESELECLLTSLKKIKGQNSIL